MVAKIAHGSSLYGAIAYNHDKLKTCEARILGGSKLLESRENETEMSLQQILKSFEYYLHINKRTHKPVVHISLNPAPEDKINPDKLLELANAYMRKMGYGQQPYVVYEHTDIERKHLHIVTVNVDENGKKITDSYEKNRSMKICRELEITYSLKQIHPEITQKSETKNSNSNKSQNKNKKTIDEGIYPKKVNYQQSNLKDQIVATLKFLIHSYKYQTFGEYNAFLSCYNIQAKLVDSKKQGNVHDGIIYQATTNEGKVIGTPINSSRMDNNLGYQALNQILNNNVNKIKQEGLHVQQSKSCIAQALKNYPSKEQFIEVLRTQGIGVVFRENEDKRIYGVTFVDHNNKLVYNGSRLGKEFSANAFHELFKNPPPPTSMQAPNVLNQSKSADQLDQETPKRIKVHDEPPAIDYRANNELAFHDPIFGESTAKPNHRAVDVDEIFGTYDLDLSHYDSEEEAFARRMKKKVRKKRGRGL